MTLEFRLPRSLRDATFPEDANLFWDLVDGMRALTRAAKDSQWPTATRTRSAPEVEGIIEELTGLLRQKHADDYLPKMEGRTIHDLGEVTLDNWELQICEAMKIILSHKAMGKRDGRPVNVAYADAVRLHQLLADTIGVRFYLATVDPTQIEESTPQMRKTMEHLAGLKYVNNGRRNDRVTQMFDRLWSKVDESGEKHISRIAAPVPEGRKRSSQIFYGFAHRGSGSRTDQYELAIRHLENVGFQKVWLEEFGKLVNTSNHLLPFRLPEWTFEELKKLRPEEYKRQDDLLKS